LVKGDEAAEGINGRAEDLMELVNHQVRAVSSCFQSTNLGASCADDGIRPVTRFGPARESATVLWASVAHLAEEQPGQKYCKCYAN